MTEIQTKNCSYKFEFRFGPHRTHFYYIHTHTETSPTVVLMGRSLEGACAIGVGEKRRLRGGKS